MKLSIDAPRDAQSVTPQWDSVTTAAIEGVVLREMKQVLTDTGALVEILRAEWLDAPTRVDQVILRSIDPGLYRRGMCTVRRQTGSSASAVARLSSSTMHANPHPPTGRWRSTGWRLSARVC